MSREAYVRICQRLEVKFRGPDDGKRGGAQTSVLPPILDSTTGFYADSCNKEAESSSRNTHADGLRRTTEAGQNVVTGPVSASRTANAFRRSGTQQIQESAVNKPEQVIVIAVRGT